MDMPGFVPEEMPQGMLFRWIAYFYRAAAAAEAPTIAISSE